ncbi:fibronectin type III domain-containing protein [Chryseolinea lacunae]|uniref:Fibronectin type III domain-containing protein n=1 Tax=Chryseolinea lacunae TaxID=2801331 RepID=A0ABS1L306_9BACT|nr:fibronectin type III domain-containing protein [Chryseolinea lacunae]MBL0745955.1 fibronectin type III domain-containing protein [Chryseolinea lacunae]
MKTIVRVALNHSNLSDEALIVKMQGIIKSMTNNANFPAPLPELDALSLALTDYEAALVATQTTGSKQDTARKNEHRKNLQQAYRVLGNVVDNKSNNDLAVLLSSGFEARKSPSAPAGRLDKPTDIEVQATQQPGTIKISVGKISRARIYMFQYALGAVTDESQWISVTSTVRTKVIDGLESGKQYSFRVGGVGTDPFIFFSDPVIRFVA